jgi:aminoglycoside 6'-N-acetyltransferase
MNVRGNIHFKPLNESHFDLMLRWFNKPHVQAFYSLRTWTFEEVCKKLEPYVRGEKQITGFIIYLKDYPIGYIQSCPIKNHPWETQDISEEIIKEAAGFDVFIGEEAYLNQGLGKQIIDSFLKEHIWPNYQYCFVDPDIRNEASMRLFQKCGFIEHKQIDSQDTLKQPVTLRLLMKKREKFSMPS